VVTYYGIAKNGFKVSLEDIENSLDEFKGDFEIGSDGKYFWDRKYYTALKAVSLITYSLKK
jgi:hypothetical protein